MKVLVLTHSYPRYSGDFAGNFVWRLANALSAQGVQSRVLAPAGVQCDPATMLDGIPVHRFRYAPRRYETLAYTGSMAQDVAQSWTARAALLGLLGADFVAAVRERREFMPDLIHAHWWFPSGLVGTWLSALANIPLVVTSHGSDVRLAHKPGIGRTLGRAVLGSAQVVTTVSRWLSNTAREIAPELQPVVAPMPVDTELFVPNFDIDRWPARFLFAGRLNAQKGIGDALHAIQRMRRTDVALDVVGDSAEREKYVALAKDLGIAHRVAFHGQQSQEKLRDFYQRATALVMPSTGEGLGLTAVEALLCETPVIAYDSGGLPDVVRPGVTGLLAPPGDVNALAQAMDHIVENDQRRITLGAAGRLFALGTFSPEATARHYAEIYRDALRPRAR